MRPEDLSKIFDELEDLLDREKQMLIHGKLDQIGQYAELKGSLITRIAAIEDVPPDRMAALQDKVNRNQILLNSAMEGVRAVAERLSDLRRVRSGLETYDSSGRKTRHGGRNPGTVEKRA